AGWQPFQIRGTYMSREEGIPSGPLVLYGTVHASSVMSLSLITVQIRDMSRRFDNDDLSFSGSGATFEQALKDAFTTEAKAYPAGLVAIEAEEIAAHAGYETAMIGGGTGKTVGFQIGTDSRYKRAKAAVWDPAASFVVNMAGIIAMGVFPPSAAIVAPSLAVYNSAAVVDRMHTQAQRGTLTFGSATTSVGEIALNVLPMLGSAQPFTRGWFLLEGANWGGQAVLLTASAVQTGRDLQARDVQELSRLYEQLQQQQQYGGDPTRIEATKRDLMARAAQVSDRIEQAFDAQIGQNALFAVAGSLAHRAGAMTDGERIALIDEVQQPPIPTESASAGEPGTPPHESDAVGAVKGKDVYPDATFVKDGVTQTAKLNDKKFKAGIEDAVKAAPAGVTKAVVAEIAGTRAVLKMEVTSGKKTAEVTVTVTTKSRGDLAESKAHGPDAGPARLKLTHNASSGKWTAEVEISASMHQDDVRFAIDHELTEAAEIVKRHPGGAAQSVLQGEMQAGVMKAGATSDKVTAHDVAAARELVNLWNDYAAKGTSKKGAARKEVLDRALEAQGLTDGSLLPEKLDILRNAGAPESLLQQLKRSQATRVFDAHVHALNGRPSTFDPTLIEHLLYTEPHDPTSEQGFSGGHYTRQLLMSIE
ncbi:MAG TPA: hypothetical protein VHV78_00100, partial [Gemmatimonadaceae bacterium]|nr:hypothetical protein [Gemmatimonadaceae bacterium]